MEQEEKKSNKKLILFIVLGFVAVLLCYAFVVLYFFCISPENIKLKLGLWPLLSDNQVGEIYLDAAVEITFSAEDDFDTQAVSVVGINVRKDGYVLAPFTEFRNLSSNTTIQIKTNFGKVFDGKLLFGDENLNISIFKCENNVNKQEKIEIPYVNIADASQISASNVLAVSSPFYFKNVWTGTMASEEVFSVYSTNKVGGFDVIDFVVEGCMEASLDGNFVGGAILDKKGNLLGLSYQRALEDGNFVIMPVGGMKGLLSKVVFAYENGKAYENVLTQNLIGFDAIKLDCFMQFGSMQDAMQNQFFYFNGAWQAYTNPISVFQNWQKQNGGFFVFENFVFEEATIEKNSVISCVKSGNKTYQILNILDLLNAIYSSSGTIEIGFNKFVEIEGTEGTEYYFSNETTFVSVAV